MIQAKLKKCSGCGEMKRLWKSKPPLCQWCANNPKYKTVKPIKVKAKPRVNGKPLHTAIYMSKLGYGDEDFVPSELNGQRTNDVHHIDARGAGGSVSEDRIENLMGLTRQEHTDYGDKVQYMAPLFKRHREFLSENGVRFDNNWFEEQIAKYEDDSQPLPFS